MAAGGVEGLLERAGDVLVTAGHHFAVGGLAGGVGALVVFPFDVVKTKMQAQTKGDGAGGEGGEEEYSNVVDCFLKVLAKDGTRGLYAGIVPQLLGVAPEKAIKLTVNDMLLSAMKGLAPSSPVWMLEVVAGAGGGFSQVLFTNPYEIVKIRQQTLKRGAGEGSQDGGVGSKPWWRVAQELGPRGLYTGSSMTLARDMPYSAIFFSCFSLLKDAFPGNSFLAGAMAAIPAAIICTPVDVIKTRLQMEVDPGSVPFTGPMDCLRQLLAREGPSALFKGATARLLRQCPQFGITLLIYDLF